MDNQVFELLKEKLDEVSADIKTLQKDVGGVKEDLRHYKGFVGGVTFVFAMVWSGITFFFTQLKSGGGNH